MSLLSIHVNKIMHLSCFNEKITSEVQYRIET